MGTEEMGKPTRRKYWKELTDSEKLERTREVIKSLESRIGRLSNQLSEFREHSHSGDKIVVPYKRYGYGGDCEKGKPANPGEVYF